jgi:DNA-binding response OmpR family regulator
MCLSSEPGMRSSNARILYVEDDADTRVLVSHVLARDGYVVVVAEDPEQAARLAQIGSFDLYLIDNWMPGASGIELCGWLRKFDNDTPILFYSGAAYEQDKRAALAAGAQGYLTKPADNEKLPEEVSRLISDARRARTATNLENYCL